MKSDFMGNLSTIIVPGDVYFVTTTVIDCTKIFIEDKYCQIIIDNLRFYREKYGFKLYSFVVMPNHVHLLILPKFDEVGSKEPIFTDRSSQQPGHVGSLEPTKVDPQTVHVGSLEPTRAKTISDIMRDLKKYTAVQIIKQLKIDKREDLLKIFSHYAQEYHPNKRRKYQVWMDGFWSTNIYSEKYFNQKLDYIHNNPIRARLVKDLAGYPWSSYQNYCCDNSMLLEIDFSEF